MNPAAIYKAWKRKPLSVSQEARQSLVKYLVQRVHDEPWRLDLVLDLFAVRRVDGYRIELPTPQVCEFLLLSMIWIGGTIRRYRRTVVKPPRPAQKTRRVVQTLGQIVRSILLDATGPSHQPNLRFRKGDK